MPFVGFFGESTACRFVYDFNLPLAHSCIIAAASWNLCPNSQSQLQMRESFTASLAQAKLIDTSRENHHLSRSIEYQISIT